MIGHVPVVEVAGSGDDSDGPDPEDVESKVERLKNLSVIQLEDEITKFEGYESKGNSVLVLRDNGAKITKHLELLKSELTSRGKKQSPAASTPESEDIEILSKGPGTVGDVQTRRGTRVTTMPELCRGLGTSSTAKIESSSTKAFLRSPTGFSPPDDFKLASCKNGKTIVSTERSSQSPSPERGALSVERTTRVSSGEQAGPSSRELLKSKQYDQSGGCIICKKTSHLNTVPGKDGLYCSVCRRKAKTPDPSFHLDNDLRTPDAKTIGRIGRKRARQADTIGGTPDTAMEIDSSDDDEKAQAGSGSAHKGPSNEVPRTRSGLRSTNRRRLEGYKVAYPSRTDPDAVEILPADLQRLDPMEFLNDTVIDFYIKYIQRDEFLGSDGRQRFHFFNSFFYKKLSEVVSAQKKKGGADFSKLRKWTKGTNIFEKEYLFVPIHDKLHWSLAIICFPGSDKGSKSERCVIHLDSMTHGHDSQRVFRLLRCYLVAEWKHSVETGENEADECIHTLPNLKADNIPCKKVPVPLQENESDCGLFLLHYIRKFVEHAPSSMKSSLLDGNWNILGVFGRDWFLPTEASSLRTSIHEQIIRLFDQEIEVQNQSAFGQVNEESVSNGGNATVCEVVIPSDADAAFPRVGTLNLSSQRQHRIFLLSRNWYVSHAVYRGLKVQPFLPGWQSWVITGSKDFTIFGCTFCKESGSVFFIGVDLDLRIVGNQ